MTDPFVVLGVPPSATLAEVRAARRRLAKQLHPDHGGDADRMSEVNRAFDLAVKAILRPPAPAPAAPHAPASSPEAAPGPARETGRRPPTRWMGRGVQQDTPSFTIESLPAEAFEALLVAASWLGEVLIDDPPYLLEVLMTDPAPCWCRLELIPEAGASMVGLTVAGIEGELPPAIDDVRDAWVDALNQLGRWEE